MSSRTPLRLAAVLAVLISAPSLSSAWKWGSLFGDNDSDSVVTVAADARGIYPFFGAYRTVLLRVPAPEYGPPVVTRVRHVYGLPPPPPPPPPPLPLPPPVALAPRYGAPPAPPSPATLPHSAASTAAAVAAAVARTILEAHGFSRSFEVTDGHPGARAASKDPAQDLYWQGAVQGAVQSALQSARGGLLWRRRRRR